MSVCSKSRNRRRRQLRRAQVAAMQRYETLTDELIEELIERGWYPQWLEEAARFGLKYDRENNRLIGDLHLIPADALKYLD